ncbi:hypothetical protein BCR44DRAFT_1432441 [Catenaria anguillulae PL171]|uniref:Uncharacterized protein n=1 Tax=Catenaria anguillulae PL171 TaxID=765915 RepID=A0A1Y2HR63_9FUNG|nr:hypothetical protein BCR44DRAFT_1432441 [Catenaria anguillulae PL171]
MARTKRSAAGTASSDENSAATPAQPTKRTRKSQPSSSRTSLKPQAHQLDPIDDPIPAPDDETVPIDPTTDVLHLVQPCFPDIFQGPQYETVPPSKDRRLGRMVLEMSRNRDSGDWSEYPERADEEQQEQQKAYDLAIQSGAIPPPSSDILVFEHVLESPEFVHPPPTFTPFTGNHGVGNYDGFRRAVLVEFTQVRIQPVMSAKRAVISADYDGFAQYEYLDANSTKPRYESVSYALDHVETTAAFNTVTEKAFKRHELSDPYHALSKETRPRARYMRANHAYPCHFHDSHRQLGPRLLRSGIRPEMMPYVRVALRPMRGCCYDGWAAKFAYRWSVGWVTDCEDDNQVVEFMRPWHLARLPLNAVPLAGKLAKDLDSWDNKLLAWLLSSSGSLPLIWINFSQSSATVATLLSQDRPSLPATLVLCRENQINAWARDFDTHVQPMHPTSRIVTIRNITDFGTVTLAQVQQASLVVVSAEFLLHDYYSVLTAAALCTHHLPCWLWSHANTRKYCADAQLRAAQGVRFAERCQHRIASLAIAHDFHSTLAECTAITVPKRSDDYIIRDFESTKVTLAHPPVLLHLMHWRRLVFDHGVSRVSQCSDQSFELQDGVHRPARSAGIRLEPLRELSADSAVTFLGGPNKCKRSCGACSEQTTKVFGLLALTLGDVPLKDTLSVRAKWELLNAVTANFWTNVEHAGPRWRSECIGAY